MEWFFALLAGLFIAAITVPAGVSGAVFLLPVQVSLFGVPSPAVTPTNLMYNVISVPGALARYRRHGDLRSSLTRQLLVGTVPGVIAGALLRINLLPDGTVFRLLVGLLLLPLGVSLVVKSARRRGIGAQDRDRQIPTAAVVSLGAAAGIVGGVYGIGGGSLVAPLLVAIGCSPRRVAPAALTATFVTSVVGVATYSVLSLAGESQAGPAWDLAIAAGIGGLIGGYVGAALQPHVPVRLLMALLGSVSVVIALLYLVAAPG